MTQTEITQTKIQRLGTERILEVIERAFDTLEEDYLVRKVGGDDASPYIRIGVNPSATGETKMDVIVGTSTVKLTADPPAILDLDQVRCRLTERPDGGFEISAPGQNFPLSATVPYLFRIVQHVALQIGYEAERLDD